MVRGTVKTVAKILACASVKYVAECMIHSLSYCAMAAIMGIIPIVLMETESCHRGRGSAQNVKNENLSVRKSLLKMIVKVASLYSLFCASIFVLGLAIPTIYYGFEGEDSTCQEGTRGGINLSDWVKWEGLSAVVVTAWAWIISIMSLATKWEGFMTVGIIVLIIDMLFWLMWWVWGVVILATNENNNCVADGKGMAVIAIINLFIGAIRFLYIQVFIDE